MAKDNPTKNGGMRRFDELVAIRSVFGNDSVLLEAMHRVCESPLGKDYGPGGLKLH